jgi:hypothetical protein
MCREFEGFFKTSILVEDISEKLRLFFNYFEGFSKIVRL